MDLWFYFNVYHKTNDKNYVCYTQLDQRCEKIYWKEIVVWRVWEQNIKVYDAGHLHYKEKLFVKKFKTSTKNDIKFLWYKK